MALGDYEDARIAFRRVKIDELDQHGLLQYAQAGALLGIVEHLHYIRDTLENPQ